MSQSFSCCGSEEDARRSASLTAGYTEDDLKGIPEEANLGLGCGNPSALASLKPGEIVLDLGSGGGIDCFLAARQVGQEGLVIGVDMTPEMLERARAAAINGNYNNVEFRLGEIENLPVADSAVDVIISNCVINLSTDKPRVFREAFRVLRPGGRLLVSDLVLKKPLPPEISQSFEAYVACVAGALTMEDYLSAIQAAGFKNITILAEKSYPPELLLEEQRAQELSRTLGLPPDKLIESLSAVVSISLQAEKP
ncbi:MAG: arsenite methyltransferase [Candidatus Saccharicenans sp.]|uniref:arsenite methyltransferase n=1 Tax=Candidatus Saccharicenans sp. TaxID=2819258 RepID=UPI004048EC3B